MAINAINKCHWSDYNFTLISVGKKIKEQMKAQEEDIAVNVNDAFFSFVIFLFEFMKLKVKPSDLVP